MYFVCCNKPPIVSQQLISVFASPDLCDTGALGLLRCSRRRRGKLTPDTLQKLSIAFGKLDFSSLLEVGHKVSVIERIDVATYNG